MISRWFTSQISILLQHCVDLIIYVFIFVNEEIETKGLPFIAELSKEMDEEVCCIYVKCFNMFVTAVYRPLSGTFEILLNILVESLNLVGCDKRLLLAGDLNIHFRSNNREDCRFAGLVFI